MTKLLTVFAVSMILAYMSEKNVLTFRLKRGKTVDLALIVMIAVMCMFCGLRTAYNDTGTYIRGFNNAPPVAEYIQEPSGLFENPLYYLWVSFFRHHISDNVHVYLLSTAFFTIGCMTCFIKKYSENFPISIVLFFSLQLFTFNFAGIKQCIAIAIITLAVTQYVNGHKIRFFILVGIAMFFHTYAIMVFVLLLFKEKPWSPITYLAIGIVIVFLLTFETVVSDLLDVAESLGKDISEDVMFNTAGINIMRLAVYAVPPMISFVFRKFINRNISVSNSMMINMSILSFLVMAMGLSSGANMFGRSARYFELGSIISFPYLINHVFEKKTANWIFGIASCCYMFFFWYGNNNFDSLYRAIDMSDFIKALF